MYASFNLSIEESSFDEYYFAGKKLHDANKRIVERALKSFKNGQGQILASKLISNWFPSEAGFDVFLSHSHRDAKSVIALSGWLHETFGLTSFIDSSVWGYSEELLKLLDDEYCWDDKNEIYLYSRRNKSTSHVYMMLSTALAKMIDQCEAVFFVNTPNSFRADEYIKNRGVTESPWIFSEIAMTSLVRTKKPAEHRRTYLVAENRGGLEEFKIPLLYDTDISHFIDLDYHGLIEWSVHATLREQLVRPSALDVLYDLKVS